MRYTTSVSHNIIFQWSFGVTSWEVFSLGRTPYPTTSPAEVLELLDSGSRLTQPTNAACSDEM